jgi:hypothetical protein
MISPFASKQSHIRISPDLNLVILGTMVRRFGLVCVDAILTLRTERPTRNAEMPCSMAP